MNNVDSTQYSARNQAIRACEHCQGIVDHERWCVTCDPRVHYAFEIVRDPSLMTLTDTLILHSLGAAWINLAV
jgi:hypothetical protein